jgi:hypothetical protein
VFRTRYMLTSTSAPTSRLTVGEPAEVAPTPFQKAALLPWYIADHVAPSPVMLETDRPEEAPVATEIRMTSSATGVVASVKPSPASMTLVEARLDLTCSTRLAVMCYPLT